MVDFAPSYQITVTLPGGQYNLRNLTSLRSGLSTSLNVGGLDLVLSDPTREIGRILGRSRHGLPVALMAPLSITARNMYGASDTAWTGLITSSGPGYDAQKGLTWRITAGDGLKPFLVQSQTAQDVAALAISSFKNISASAVLRYAAQACKISPGKLHIDVQADAGSGIQRALNAAVFTNPQQASWLAVLNGIASFTGNVLYADERGIVNYVPVSYARPPKTKIRAEQVYSWNLYDSDEGVITTVEARFGVIPVTQAAPKVREATGLWAQQLRPRLMLTYMPWILQPGAATWAAKTMLAQGMAQLGVGQVTIIADATYHVGDTVYLEFAGKDAYIQSVTQEWEWGGLLLTTLGLTYVRDHGATVPTGVTPTKSVLGGLPDTQRTVATPAQTSAAQLANTGATNPIPGTLSTTTKKTLIPAGYTLLAPSTQFITGAVVALQDPKTKTPIVLGSAATQGGHYSVYASASATGLTVYDTKHVVTNMPAQAILFSSPLPDGVQTDYPTIDPAAQTSGQGAGDAARRVVQQRRNRTPGGAPSTAGAYTPPAADTGYAQGVMQAALNLRGAGYQTSGWTLPAEQGGRQSYSCVAMIARAMRVSGFAAALDARYGPNEFSGDLAADSPLYTQHVLYSLPGNQLITTGVGGYNLLQPGDVLFFSGTGGTWPGQQPEMFTHAALFLGSYHDKAVAYGSGAVFTLNSNTAMVTANNKTQGVTVDELSSTYWKAHFSAAMRPDYTLTG